MKILVLTTLVLCSLQTLATNSSTGETNVYNKTVINGKTYFIQLKKNREDDDPDTPDYIRSSWIHRGGSDGYSRDRKEQLMRKYEEMFGKLSQIPESLKEIDEDVEEMADHKDSPSYVDEEWSYNPNHHNYDLPNITHDIYEAMLENNKQNSAKNATIVKFFFETETNLSSNIIRFNIDSLANISETIVDVELHVYRLPRDNSTKTNFTENVVRLYQMTTDSQEGDEKANATWQTMLKELVGVGKNQPDVHKLANVIYISSNYAGWQVFKVKNVIENWRNGENNLGFLISTTDSKTEKIDSVNFAHRDHEGGKYQPTLVVYLDRQESRKRQRTLAKAQNTFRPAKLFKELLSKSFNPCKRHVWYVSFHELGWNNFIIAPTGYMAYNCKGSCTNLADASYSNHGKLVSMFQKTGDSAATCCVPDGYKSLLIMYYDKESNVVIKEYDDMIVSACGCR